jgi:hypothetical protein
MAVGDDGVGDADGVLGDGRDTVPTRVRGRIDKKKRFHEGGF